MDGRARTSDVDEPPERPPRGAAHLALLAIAIAVPLAVLAVGALTVPDPRGYGTHEQLGLAPCRARAIFGIPCPGCGATTAIALLVRARFAESFATHPFAFVCALALVAVAAVAVLEHARGRDLARRRRGPWRAGVLALVLLGVLSWGWTLWRVAHSSSSGGSPSEGSASARPGSSSSSISR